MKRALLLVFFATILRAEYKWEIIADRGTGEEMEALLAEKENSYLVNWRSTETGDMLIHIAANAGNLPVVEALVRHKAKIDAKDGEGRTALFIAAFRHRTKVVKYLLENGANPKIKAKDGRILFDFAQANNDAYGAAETVELFQLLVQYKAPGLNGGSGKLPPILGAAGSGNPELVRAYISAKAKIQVKDTNGATPLQLAFTQVCGSYRESITACDGSEKHTAIADMLYDAGSRVMEGKQDVTLHYAAKNGYLGLVKKILGNGADVNTPDRDGMTPLMHAATAKTERIAVIRALLEAGAKKAPSESNPTSLLDLCNHIAAQDGCSAEARRLLAN